MRWDVPRDLTKDESDFVRTLRRRSKFYVFLRQIRHLLVDEPFEQALGTAYSDKPRGVEPLPAEMMLFATLLQAYTQCSDEEAVELSKTDDRWKLVLNTLGQRVAPFSQKALCTFRKRLIEHDLDKMLIARTVELARESKVFDPKKVGQLRIAIDSAPLEGAGRVEDTINLIAHATRHVVALVAFTWDVSSSEVVSKIGLKYLTNRSVKAELDLDWSSEEAKVEGLRMVLSDAMKLQAWIWEFHQWMVDDSLIGSEIATLNRLIEQDTEPNPDGPGRRIKKGVAADRQISIHDDEMRHGRKSKSKRIDGYKRYAAIDLDSNIVVAATALPANAPEQLGADKMGPDIEQHGHVVEVHVDRAFLPSQFVSRTTGQGAELVARAYAPRNPNGFDKTDFDIDLEANIVICPAGNTVSIGGPIVRFAASTCATCEIRGECQKAGASHGRTIHIHDDELLHQNLRKRQQTPEGRQKLRERVDIEHGLAHICRRQGPRARYLGVRKNDYDLLRTSTITNLFVIANKAAPEDLPLAQAA